MKQRHRKHRRPVRNLAVRLHHYPWPRALPSKFYWVGMEVERVIPGAHTLIRVSRAGRRLQIRVMSSGQKTRLDFWSRKRRITALGSMAFKARALAVCVKHLRRLRDVDPGPKIGLFGSAFTPDEAVALFADPVDPEPKPA